MKPHSSKKLLVWMYGLYLTAGYLNALTLLLFNETAVGQTGRTTNIVYFSFLQEWVIVIPLLFLSGSFLLGAILGGFIFPNSVLSSLVKSYFESLLDVFCLYYFRNPE